ncbi:MAG TPA: LuxR C-terminal-related transcriptional regulator [Kofleriaceae bacterium]|nr:LuxR C-terminal-related transcriptional regulator [Kofleriaceae bacterium]
MVSELSGGDRALVRDIAEELGTIRLDRPGSGIADVLPAARRALECESLLVLSPLERITGWDIERFDHDNFPDGPEFRDRFLRFFATAPRRYAWYDASRPEPEQRNRLIDALAMIPPSELEVSRIYREVVEPSGLHRHRQPRVLVCDGASLLGWFGSFHPVPFDARQNRMLVALVPPVQARLRMERQLAHTTRARAVLEQALEHIGAPAFVVGAAGQVLEASSSALALFETRRAELTAAIADAVAGRPTSLPLEVTRIAEPGTPVSYLAIVRAGSSDARIANAVLAASVRWTLTPRQREVLDLVVRGIATPTIAAQLGVSARAIELHLTALFDRASVDNRSALISAVLAPD